MPDVIQQLGISIVGFGGMGSHHAVMIKPVHELRLNGTFDILAQRQEYAASLGYRAFNSLEELMLDKGTDIVLIATPNNIHKEIAIKSLKAGKHVICEKPVTLNSKDLQDILDVAKACSRVFVVHQNRRWDEDYCIIKKIYDEGTIGRIFNIESRTHGCQGIPAGWRTQREFGGGMLLDWGVHLIDQVLTLVDEKITGVYCRLSYVLGGECDDGVHLILSFESGTTALIEVETWNFEKLPRWYVNGLGGTVLIKDFSAKEGCITRIKEKVQNNSVPVGAGKGISITMAPRAENSLEALPLPELNMDVRDYYRNVVAAIRGTEELIVKPAQSMRVLKLIEAAVLSHQLNRVVDFE